PSPSTGPISRPRVPKATSTAWKARYDKRAGIEGTLSQGVRAFELRQTRYVGLQKTALQHILTAAAINVSRLTNWLTEIPHREVRPSRFAALAPAA
ncbi:MAG: transposase, partial [Chloroflexota bacterium]|nr:transposase [Chloroflexota bacterium]